ncbi:MAG: OB-fold nucleic acid binding domain-containing protein [Candidatus Bathyarchaeota archaeon]
MPTKEEIIIKILQAKPDLSRKEVEEKVNQKKGEMGKLLTDEGAAYMVANDLEVEVSGETRLKTQLAIKDITVGTSDVTINGTVVAIYQVRSFSKSNGGEGKVAKIVMSDETGDVNVVLWDEKAEIAERRLAKGDAIRVNHGYVKAGMDGNPEINVGQKGSVVILPERQRLERTNVHEEVYSKINEISEGDSVIFVGLVEGVSAISTFRRRDEREGKVARVRLADETGRIIAVFWDEKTDFIQQVQRGDYIKIVNGHIRRGLAEGLEIYVGEDSEAFLNEKPKGTKFPSPIFTKIGSLNPKMPDVDVLARVTEVGHVREFIRQSGEKGSVGEIFLMDETGSVRLSLWDDKAGMLKEISSGNIVLAEGAYTREGFGGGLSLNLGKMGTLRLNPDITEAKKLPQHSTGLVNIIELKAGFSASVQGKILDKPLVKTVSTRDGREIKLASLKIRDNSGAIKASFWGDLADKFEDIKPETVILVRNIYVKNGFAGELELSSRTTTEVEIAPDSAGEQDLKADYHKEEPLKKGESVLIQEKL